MWIFTCNLFFKMNVLQERETKLKKALTKVKQHRNMLRSSRQKKEFPTVAVVGYTNSGKQDYNTIYVKYLK